MATKGQMNTAIDHIKDVISRTYIESDRESFSVWVMPKGGSIDEAKVFQSATTGMSKPFENLPQEAKVKLLSEHVYWKGFNQEEAMSVIQRVVDGESPDLWMEGIGRRNTESDTTFQVWLNRSHPPDRFDQVSGEKPFPSFPEGYGHFANVRAATMDEVVKIIAGMPNIFSDDFHEWKIDAGVQTFLPGVIAREIELGDVIVDSQDRPHRVGRDEFKEITADIENNPTYELIANFHSRIEGLKRDGVPDYPPLGNTLPWAEASEERKLNNIVWESMALSIKEGKVISVPDIVRLEAVEQNVDYAKLDKDIRTSLEILRFAPEEIIAAELERIGELAVEMAERDRQPLVAANERHSEKAEFNRILSEKSNAGESGQKYEKHLNEATERAIAQISGKEKGGHER